MPARERVKCSLVPFHKGYLLTSCSPEQELSTNASKRRKRHRVLLGQLCTNNSFGHLMRPIILCIATSKSYKHVDQRRALSCPLHLPQSIGDCGSPLSKVLPRSRLMGSWPRTIMKDLLALFTRTMQVHTWERRFSNVRGSQTQQYWKVGLAVNHISLLGSLPSTCVRGG